MKKELIKISEFQRRRWGENGTPRAPKQSATTFETARYPASRSENSGTLIGQRSADRTEMTWSRWY